jgi:hypothetical protein
MRPPSIRTLKQSEDVRDYICGLACAYRDADFRGVEPWEPEEVEE